MSVSGPWFVWMVVGAVFAALFLIACVISVVKAVRDRRQIKARNQARRAALTSNHVPRDANCAGCNKRLRPNLILIHDTEKEQRVKRWAAAGSGGAEPLSVTSPRNFTPSGNRGSAHVEITTEAEVAGQSMDISCISDGTVGGDVRVDSRVVADDSCLLEKRGHLAAGDTVSVDVGTKAIRFRRRSTGACGTDSLAVNGRGLVSAFPVPLSSPVDSLPFGDHSRNGDALSDRTQRCRNGVQDMFNFRSTAAQHRSPCHQFRDTGRWSFTGCSDPVSLRSSLYCPACQRQLATAALGPRRNSYAAGLSGAIRIVVPSQRRHSDECRHAFSGSLLRLCPNAMRSRRFKRGGTDNLAYETLDDEGGT